MTTAPNQARPAADAAEPEVGGHDATLPGEESNEKAPRIASPVARERIGRYRVVGMLGSGGMGRVYEAVDERLDRRVAVKVLHQHLSEQHRQRLVREAQALARLSHPNVVHVYEIEEADGETFVAMELVRGQTLHEWAQHEPRRDWRSCVAVYRQAGAGLAAAHAEGLVHRDFKPGNAIIDASGRVRVLDFGLVRQAGEREPEGAQEITIANDIGDVATDGCLTTTGTVLGTPAYMSPEQMSRHDVDAHGDQFSFCVSLYEAVYGERPFAGDTIASLVFSVTAGDVRPAPKRSAVPTTLRRVLLRGLATEPARRWPAMEALLTELARPSARKPTRWLVVGLAGALVAAGYAARGMGDTQQTDAIDAQAEVLYEEGLFAFRDDLFDDAVEKWSESYALSGRVLLLHNISVALTKRYERARDVGDLLRARALMTNFLINAEIDPDLDENDAKELIAELDAMIAEDRGR